MSIKFLRLIGPANEFIKIKFNKISINRILVNDAWLCAVSSKAKSPKASCHSRQSLRRHFLLTGADLIKLFSVAQFR